MSPMEYNAERIKSVLEILVNSYLEKERNNPRLTNKKKKYKWNYFKVIVKII